MKKVLVGVLAVVMAGSLCACGNKGNEGGTVGENGEYSIDKATVFATFDVGGGVDTFGRDMSAMLKNTGLWDGTFVYENVGGASGQVGLTEICEQHNGDDSYLIPTSDNVLQSGYLNNIEGAYGYKDLSLVSRLYCEYRVYVTAPSTGIKSLDDVLKKAQAGEDIIGGNSGNGGASHIALSGLAYEMGINMRHVPYGDDEDIVAVLSGEADLGALGSNEALTYIRSGDLIPLAVAAPERLDQDEMKDVPTCLELGYDCEFGTSRGWVLPGDVNPAAVEYWDGIFRQLSETEEFQEYVHNAGGTVAYLGPDDFYESNVTQDNETRAILEKIGFYD